ncbi:MAG: SDR family NAD(P)-dependent oxidoreductase [Puniceicoccaceae bacterium]
MPSGQISLAQQFPVALVTGASSGIGQAIAEALKAEGITVYGTTRRPDREGLDPAIQWLAFDGSTSGGIESFIRDNEDLLSKINLLINNAGSSCFGKASEIPLDVLTGQQTLLLAAPVQLTRTVIGGMQERGSGAVVNVSSLAALFPIPYMEGYSACKAALSSYSRGLMLQLAGSGVSIIDFQPGDYRTAFNEQIKRYGEGSPRQERVWQQLEANIAAAPPPEQAARDILRALRKGRSCTVKSGGFFQSRVAPFGLRILPKGLVMALTRRYFKLDPG